jgi:hypothetical protein
MSNLLSWNNSFMICGQFHICVLSHSLSSWVRNWGMQEGVTSVTMVHTHNTHIYEMTTLVMTHHMGLLRPHMCQMTLLLLSVSHILVYVCGKNGNYSWLFMSALKCSTERKQSYGFVLHVCMWKMGKPWPRSR